MPKRLSPWSACIGACTGGTWSLVWAWVFVLGVWGPCYAKMEMVRATVQALAAVESRLAGYPGAEVAADYVERELAAAGIRNVRREEFEVVVPVDEVDGIHAIDERTLKAASASGTQASARSTQGVLQWKGRSLRWLDEAQLLSAVTRSLA